MMRAPLVQGLAAMLMLSAGACYKDLDPSNVKCAISDKTGCPDGYTCNGVHCVLATAVTPDGGIQDAGSPAPDATAFAADTENTRADTSGDATQTTANSTDARAQPGDGTAGQTDERITADVSSTLAAEAGRDRGNPEVADAGIAAADAIPDARPQPDSLPDSSQPDAGFDAAADAQAVVPDAENHTLAYFPLPATGAQPRGITQGPDGNLWFTDFGANKIGRISSSGDIVTYDLPTATSGPTRITAGPDGNLWFTESWVGQIAMITPAGKVTEFQIPTADSKPNGIVAGPDGNLWFTEMDGNKIANISRTGMIVEFDIGKPSSQPSEIIAGRDGNLWFTYSNSIGRMTTTGLITEYPVNCAGDGLLQASDGTIWYACYYGNLIGRLTPGSSPSAAVVKEFPLPPSTVTTWGSGPSGITQTVDGNIWFTEYDGSAIGRLTPSGQVTEFPLRFAKYYPEQIVVGADGNLWFTDFGNGDIGRINP